MKKPITAFLKAKKNNKAAIQGFVPAELRSRVRAQMREDRKDGYKITWDILLEAALKSYLSERGALKKSVNKGQAI